MNLKIVIFLSLIYFVTNIKSGSKATKNESSIKAHYEIIFQENKETKLVYLNLKTKSLWSCHVNSLTMILVDGASGSGLIIDMENLKAWKLKNSWKSNNGNDLAKSVRKYLSGIKSYKNLINKNEKEIDLRKGDNEIIDWSIKKILVNILSSKISNPNILMLINLEFDSFQSKDYGSIYFNQNGKGIEVAVSLTRIQVLSGLVKPILSDVDIEEKELSKLDVDWKKAFGYTGQQAVASLVFVEEIVGKLEKKLKNFDSGFVEDISKTCSGIIKIREKTGSGSNESD